MRIIDIIIIAVLIVISGLIIFQFWKNRKKTCHGCPYAKNCNTCDCKTQNKKSIQNPE